MNLHEALLRLANVSETASLQETASAYLHSLPGICHASLWGIDSTQRRVFLAFEFISDVGISSFPQMTVLRFGEGIVGRTANGKTDITLMEADFPAAIPRPDIVKFLQDHSIKTISTLNLTPSERYSGIVAIASTNAIHSDIEGRKSEFRAFFSSFLCAYDALRSAQFESQLLKIVRHKTASSGLKFLKGACDDIAKAFSASTFSVWKVEDGSVKPEHFSEATEERGEYILGQGLTGNVASTGRAIMLHSLSDSNEIYQVKWLGRVSDFNKRPPDPRDHIIIIPLKYPRHALHPSSVNGVIRFVSHAEQPSFWPIDFTRATALGDALSDLIYSDELLQAEKINSDIQKNLLSLAYRAREADSLDDITLDFLCEMEKWPGVSSVTVVDDSPSGGMDFSNCRLLNEAQRAYIAGCPKDKWHSPQKLEPNIHIFPIASGEEIYAFLIARTIQSDDTECKAWLQIGSLILSHHFAIQHLIQEKEKLRRDNEEQQMLSIAGTLARMYAHEVINGLKAIDSWIDNSQDSSPNYNALRKRIEEMWSNVREQLDSTGFLRLNRRRCTFNAELEKYLARLGYRNGRKLDGCELRLSVAGNKHREVHFDPYTLIAILNNLVVNAKEQYLLHNRKGPIEVSLVEVHKNQHLYVGFHVRDYAVGISLEDLPKVFKPGFTTKPQGQGLGLGIVDKLVKGCDGTVSVYSELGRGTTFEVLYPVIEDVNKLL